MKFLAEYQEDIYKAFESHGYIRADFHFVKKKGRIITKPRDGNEQFSYILKKDVKLDPLSKDFIEVSYFETRFNDENIETHTTWDKVMKRYITWLMSLGVDKNAEL